MTVDRFESVLREFLRRQPFQPFVVELLDGHAIPVQHTGVAFGGGAATYISPQYELVEFTCEAVRDIYPANSEKAR